jgi:hypothetical protein
MKRSLLVLALVAAGCRRGPLHDIDAGERRGGRDEIDTKKTVPAGSPRALACRVRWRDAPLHTKIDAAWWFEPAPARDGARDGGGERKKIHGAERWTRESSGTWLTHVETTGGWEAGTYTCEFATGPQKLAAKIVVK